MMMKPKFEFGNQDTDDKNNGKQLLNDIEEISKALYLHNTPFKPSTLSSVHNRSKSDGKVLLSNSQVDLGPRFVNEDLFHGDKKFSLGWNWKKPLKVLSHLGSHKFICCFKLHVHSIEGLPLSFNGNRLSVLWKRKRTILQTCPSRVLQGAAEFDETLTHRCVVYGSRVGSSHSVKYDSKRFLIYASIVGDPEHDLGKHQVDLTRLLPLSLEELSGDKSSGKSSTSFRLAGKVLGASLNVSFSYQVMKDGIGSFGPSDSDIKIWQAGSFPSEIQHNELTLPSDSDGVMVSHEALPNPGSGFSKSISFLYQKLDEGDFHNSAWADSKHLRLLKSQFLLNSESSQESNLYDSDDSDTEFSVSEQGVEILEGDSFKLEQTRIEVVDDVSIVEIIDADEIIKDDDLLVDKNTKCDSADTVCASSDNEDMTDNRKHNCSSSCVDVDLPCLKVEDSVPESSEFLSQEHRMVKKSRSFDDIIDSVASDFLNMLAVESDSVGSSCGGDPQSPREKLLRHFEKESLGNFAFDFDANEEELENDTLGLSYGDNDVDSDLSSIIQAAEEEYVRANQSLIQRRKAKILEDLETDSLMQQWGINERDFENSPRTLSGGFGSPIELSDEEPSILPSIGEGLGSFVQTMSGGFLRSLHPSLFKYAKNCGNLIIQASNSVVLPAKMGDDIFEILLQMASTGVEELCDHICKLMPLQDITGKSIKHVLWDAITNREDPRRWGSWQHDLFEEFPYKVMDSMTLEAIAPMTINKIESLLIEGLRIQSGMSNEKAPSYIHSRNDLDGLMSLSITLDQWLRLDSGNIGGDQNLEQILKILKAHHSKITELDNEEVKNAMEKTKEYGEKHGLLANHITVAFVIQHRDPLRNYEPVGVPMLVLTQVERVHSHAMDEEYNIFLENANIDGESETSEFRFKIKDIHLAGILTKAGNMQLWGTEIQRQSGLRWLLASGMANTGKHSSSKSKSIVRSTPLFTNKLLNQDMLWSISYVDNNLETKAHIRNPDIIFPN